MARGLAAAVAAAASFLAPAAQQQPSLAGWLTYGNGPQRTNFTRAAVAHANPHGWHVHLNGAVLMQPLVVRSNGQTTVYAGTAGGTVYALSESGGIRWQTDFGALTHGCRQLESYGVTGTPAIDARTRALYAADALGRLHALDLVTGRERPGWPVTLYRDYRQEMVWGALLVARGAVYVPTGSFCDRGPMQGKLFRVSLANRRVRSWAPVPKRLGGGGGIWGWGGVAFDRGSIFAAPGNAFSGNEAAGYAEHLVQLSIALRVRSANHPRSVAPKGDIDFAGAPMLVSAPRCPELVIVASKNGRIYAWRAGRVRRGPAWTLDLRGLKPAYPLVAQTAYSPPLRSVFVATGTYLVRATVGRDCRPSVTWSAKLPRWAWNGSPTVAGGTVWLGTTKTKRLLGVDARSGRVRVSLALDGAALAAPTVVGGRLYAGTMAGGMYGLR